MCSLFEHSIHYVLIKNLSLCKNINRTKDMVAQSIPALDSFYGHSIFDKNAK